MMRSALITRSADILPGSRGIFHAIDPDLTAASLSMQVVSVSIPVTIPFNLFFCDYCY